MTPTSSAPRIGMHHKAFEKGKRRAMAGKDRCGLRTFYTPFECSTLPPRPLG